METEILKDGKIRFKGKIIEIINYIDERDLALQQLEKSKLNKKELIEIGVGKAGKKIYPKRDGLKLSKLFKKDNKLKKTKVKYKL